MSGDIDRDIDYDRLVLGYIEEVHMKGFVSYRMILHFMKDGSIFCPVKIEVYDVGVGSVGKGLEIFRFYSEKYVFQSLSVKVAWNKSFFPDAFYYGLVSDLADPAFKFDVFHKKLKKCYSETAGVAASPLH